MRIILLITIIAILFIAPAYISLALAGLYAVRWFAPELLLIGMSFDVYYAAPVWPYYTLALTAIIIVAEFVRPSFSFYTK